MKLENKTKVLELIEELDYLNDKLETASRIGANDLSLVISSDEIILNIKKDDDLICFIIDNIISEIINKMNLIKNELIDL